MKRAVLDGRLSIFDANQRIAAWLGHALNANSESLILKLLPDFSWFWEHPLFRPE